MSNENGQKPPPSILVGRFKALLKQREDDPRLRNSQPSTEEIVQIYEALLGELTSNVKPIITDLTIIAEQHREHARGIAYAICARILEVFIFSFLPSCKPQHHCSDQKLSLFQFSLLQLLSIFSFAFCLFIFNFTSLCLLRRVDRRKFQFFVFISFA